MKKKGRIILLVVLIGVSIGLAYGIIRVTPPQRIGDNLLKNWNFEAVRRSGKIKTWKEDPEGGWLVDSENPYQGDNSMQAMVGWSWLSQEIRVKPDKYYLLTAYLKSNIPVSGEGGGGNAFLGFECLDAKNQVIRSDYGIISASSLWQEKVKQIYAPERTEKIRIKIAKRQGEGSVWFDELELEQIPAVLVLNSSFEILDEQGRPKYWLEDSRGGWSVSTEGAYQGDNCMQATVGWSWLSQEIRVKPDKYYLLKAYLKSDIPVSGEGGGGNAFLGFDYLDAKGQVIEGDYGIINTISFWQQEIQQIYVPPETNKIRVKLAKRQGEGSVWFDELELEQIPAVLVLNSSFEILDEQGRPKYWLEDSRGGWSVSTEGAYEGDNCMQAMVGWSWLSQEIRVKPDENYTLKAYSRSDIIIPRGKEEWNAFLALECLNKEGEVVRTNMIQLNIPYSWKSQVISVYAPKDTEKIRMKLAKRRGGGSVWFDELKIVKLTWWYMKSTFLQRIAEDKPFFIFYFSVYFILLVLLLRLILKRQPSPKRQRAVLGKKSKESQN